MDHTLSHPPQQIHQEQSYPPRRPSLQRRLLVYGIKRRLKRGSIVALWLDQSPLMS